MKRSEMALIIRDRIRQLSKNNKFSMVDAFQLINTLKDEGMLPPKIVKNVSYDIEGWAYTDYKNEWEDEDNDIEN